MKMIWTILKVLFNLVVCGALLGGAVYAWIYIHQTEPKAEREGATRKSAMIVDVVELQRATYEPQIIGLGTVAPSREVDLSPRVSGRVIRRSPAFDIGNIVREGEVLVELDRADFEIELEQRRSELDGAEAELEVERGRQRVAERDYELLPAELRADERSLALRGPQIAAAEARVRAAKAAVDRAQLDLDRTVVRAPFDAVVLSREADEGSEVSAGDALGRLVCTEDYWVIATVPVQKLRWIQFPDANGEGGSRVEVRNRAESPEVGARVGTVHRLIGELDAMTRLARVLVVVPDPLSHDEEAHAGAAASGLILGSVVQVSIEGRPLADVVKLDRGLLQTNDTVLVMEDDGLLGVRRVEVLFKDAEHCYVASGLETGDRAVTTNLATVSAGALLQVAGQKGAAEEGAAAGEEQAE